MTKHLSILFAGESDPGNNGPFFLSTTSIIQLITSNNNELELRLMNSRGLSGHHLCSVCRCLFRATKVKLILNS
jgi:hypothetical protein